ncbi:MAG: UDP-glucose 4-epimerase GalE [Gemmataceae bacterium]
MRVLVTGGAGYIGSHTVRLLLAQGHDVWVYDNLSTGHRASVPADRLIVADLRDAARLDHVFVAHRIEAVIHFAASALVPESVRRPDLYYQNNVVASLALLETLRCHGVGRLVFSSTCATYGIPAVVPIDEDTPQRPINPYGNTKLAIEHAILDHAAAFGWSVALLRYFNAAGAHPDGSLGEDHDPETHLIPLVLQVALGQRSAVQIFGTDYATPDGTCVRDYIHVEDLARAHLLALEKAQPGRPLVCNLGTGQGHSVREVLQAAEQVVGRPIPAVESPRREGDPAALVARADRARTLLGWTPAQSDLTSIVRSAWNWHRQHPAGYDD